MSNSACEQAKGQLALASIGCLPDSEQLSLDSHLEGCGECRREMANLSDIEGVLSAANFARVDCVPEASESLRTAVLGSLDTEIARHRRASRLRVTMAAALVVLAAAGTLIGISVAGSHSSSDSFALSGPGGHATVVLTPETWGTDVDLRVTGERTAEVLTVWMRETNGSWWVAGSYRGTAPTVQVTMSCAVPESDIDAVRVTDSTGKQVLGGRYEG